MEEPLFRVLRGNPSAEEVEAINKALTRMLHDATAAQTEERNSFGQPAPHFNPVAFRTVKYF